MTASATAEAREPSAPLSESTFAALVDDLITGLRAGEKIDLDRIAADHPQFAARLQEILPSLRAVCDLTGRGGTSSDAVDDHADLLAGVLGEYRILRQIGHGGMGIVYEAIQTSLNRRVALKVLPLAAMLDPRHLQRFKNEAMAAASLDHPHIVNVYAVGCERGVHFYAMRYVEGQTLAAVIDGLRVQGSTRLSSSQAGFGVQVDSVGNALSGVPEPPQDDGSSSGRVSARHDPESRRDSATCDTDTLAAALSTLRTEKPREFLRTVAELGIQAAEALDHAHQLGIVHRDIKPSNLMIECSHLAPRDASTPRPSRGEAGRGVTTSPTTDHRPLTTPRLFITDFGLARIASEPGVVGLTMTGDLLGTLRYMSPEQAEGKSAILDHRTDIYSLGITLYELTTLRPAFPAEDRQTLIRQIASEEPVAPRRLKASIPADLETILLKSIAKVPRERYASARQLADDLHRFLKGQPITARRPSFLDRTRRWGRRHVAAVMSLMIVLAVSLTVLAVALVVVSGEKKKTATSLIKAERSLRVARDAVDSLYIDLASSWLANSSTISAIQREFLQRAAKFYEELAQEIQDDPAQLRTTATAYARIGQIHAYLYENRRAVPALETSIALGRKLVQSKDVTDDDQMELVERYRQLHELFVELGQTRQAADILAEGWELLESLSEGLNDDPARSAEAAAWYAYRGAHALRQDRPQSAEEFARQGKRLATKLRRDQPNDSNLELLFLKNCGVLSEALAAQGRLADAYNECNVVLRSCRTMRMGDLRDYRPVTDLQIQLFGVLADIEAEQERYKEAAAHYHDSLALRRKTFEEGRSPSDVVASMFRTVLGGKENWKGHYDPAAYCGYAETQIKLARLLITMDRRYEAECHLGEAMFTMSVIANNPRLGLRYEVALANAYAAAVPLCDGWESNQAPLLRYAAISIWQTLLAESEENAEYRSGVHGHQDDLAWFRAEFGDPTTLPPVKKIKEGWVGAAEQPYFVWRASEVSLVNIGDYENGVNAFTKLADARGKNRAYDWLYVAMSHAHLGEQEQAQTWYDKSAQDIAESQEPPAELIELRDAAKLLIDEKAAQ